MRLFAQIYENKANSEIMKEKNVELINNRYTLSVDIENESQNSIENGLSLLIKTYFGATKSIPEMYNYLDSLYIEYNDGTIKPLLNQFYPEWHNIWLNEALQISQFSKCQARHVGCLLVYENSVIASGINGSFPGKLNCNDVFLKLGHQWYAKEWYIDPHKKDSDIFIKSNDPEIHHKWSEIYEIHAEENALMNIKQSLGTFIDTNKVNMYVTHTPCNNCAKLIIKSGIKNVYVLYKYGSNENTESILKDNNVNLEYLEEDHG